MFKMYQEKYKIDDFIFSKQVGLLHLSSFWNLIRPIDQISLLSPFTLIIFKIFYKIIVKLQK